MIAAKLILWTGLIVLAGAVQAQTGPVTPQFIDTMTLRHYTVLSSMQGEDNRPPTDGKYAVAWFNIGFGSIRNLPVDAVREGWPHRNADGTPVEYVFFRYDPDQTSGTMDQNWFTTQEAWASYVENQNLNLLTAGSWNFQSFIISSDYEFPDVDDPVTWIRRDQHSLGYPASGELFLYVIRKSPTTPESWEWSVRGESGTNTWTAAADRAAAETAAAAWRQ